MSSGAEEAEPADLSGAGDAGFAQAAAAVGGAEHGEGLEVVHALICVLSAPVDGRASEIIRRKRA
jgi:hypothetical protein